MKKVTKAIIPAAGFGTRLLPATKAMPKEMLPIVDVPSIQYIVEECANSGITDVCIILGRNKNNIADHFDRNFEVEYALKKDGKIELLNKINSLQDKVQICYVRQFAMQGTGKAIELCKNFVGDEPFAVLFGDDVMYNIDVPVTKQLINAYENTGATIVGVQKQPKEECPKYGVVVPGKAKGKYTELLGFKEKPNIEELPSQLTGLGRFVLTPEIFKYIEKTPPAKNGEVYLPTAIELMSSDISVYAYEFDGLRYDIGDKLGYVKANIEYGLRNEEISDGLKAYLKEIISKL
ncbi:MAG TPA: UTP--glucose-1-phosphate uridylyltransferase [Clostridia bacterium]|nr:UTP--glucose-1-phosphate uridylyltransferase [Clostridia bacterium]